ncbi:MAG: S8 family serine peptidase, partial [Paludisphaera borealis]|uniref:S8 family serine peptidase n=1 Tax=Paludisphaera borealis TaxID=1387353 RepID=UPI00284570B2
MGSFKAGGSDKGPDRRRGKHQAKRQGFPRLEWLEGRLLLASSVLDGGNPIWHSTSDNPADIQNGPMANLGGQLVTLYQKFQSGLTSNQLSQQFPLLQIKNGSVQIGLTTGGDISKLGTSVVNMGMQITAASGQYGLIEGWMPISQLLNVAKLPNLVSGHPIYKPHTYYQGIANNQAQQSLFADAAAQKYNVTGAGVTVGVLSDSFNALGGYATDVSTGDLPAGITPLQDLTTGTDEGRAMMQNIYDIAPGATLQFATAYGGQLAFAQNIQALATQGKSNIIVDDVGYLGEPYFQDGLISQAINTVTAQGVTYLSAAGNSQDYGYLSTFRGAQGTVGSIGAGRFMNFSPSGAPVLQLPITTTAANTTVVFQFDQPFKTQQPVGSTAVVTSQVNFYILDSTGAIVTTGQGTNDNTATQQPMQVVTIPNAGTFTVVMQVVKGPDPGHVEFTTWDNPVIVSRQFGAAGGTYYPTTYGHSAAQNTIGVGATPWWAPAPFLSQNPLANEPFSSAGPTIIVRNPDGSLKSSPVTVLNPTITAPDGGNTTFFPPGGVIQTNNPPFPGQPATTTNLSQNLPSFFGTSSAAPNAAAVAALMKQKAPQLTPAEVRAGLIAGATTMNNTSPGQWNVTSGYGLVNAVNSLAAVDVLTVTATDPANNTVVTTTPTGILVTFNKPVQFSTVDNQDLHFLVAPTGVNVTFGTPVAVDDPNFPTKVLYPYTFSYNNPPTTTANGVYTFVVSGPITSKDGKALQPTGLISFDLEDVTAPRVNTTSTLGRLVTIQFTKPMNPATITTSNLFVARQGNTGNWSNPINLNLDPRVKLTYDALTNTATLDYSGLPQTAMPSDNYAIVVKSGPGGVTDAVGNQLDGNFNGTFPSGDNVPGGDFVQILGYQLLQPPVVTAFQLTPGTDSGLPSDQNTNISQPSFIGQIYSPFPGSVANLQVVVEFNALHGGGFDLAVGAGGRGFSGSYDVQTSTDVNGKFTFQAPFLPQGFQRVRIVVVGQPDTPPLPGYASFADRAFRIDQSAPQITGASQSDGSPFPSFLPTLDSLSLYTQDPSLQAAGYLATPSQVVYPALDPSTATNVSNYSLYRALGNGQNQDLSQYIIKATYVALPPTLDPSGAFITTYQGRIDLTFAPGLPAGVYQLAAHTKETWNGKSYPGLFDAAGNALNNLTIPGNTTATYNLYFSLQPSPVYITNMAMTNSPDQYSYTTVGGPGSYYDLSGVRANAPPAAWQFDVSNPLPWADANGNQINYSNYIDLVRSADNANAPADGNFGTLGQSGLADSGTGFTKVGGTLVGLFWFNPASNQWILSDASHPNGTRLVMMLPGGITTPDYYRVYIPNQITPSGADTRIFDIYGNQLDGEFLGNPTSTVSSQFHAFSSDPTQQFPGVRNLFNYEDMLSTGYASPAPISRMTGDGIAGGAFMTGFVVATTSHILYARPDYQEDPLNPATAPDGSLAKPYSTLAPESDPTLAPPNPFHDPNGGQNSTQFFLSGFNPNYDRNGNGQFDRSVLYAASQLAYTGPVVAIALPGTPQRNPITGVITQQPFVLQAPAGQNSYNDGSASVPFDTTLVFTPGSTLKAQNAALFVQNQGSALQVQGGTTASQQVNFTSYNDASIGGATNNNPNTNPRAGDWGGIVFRSYNESIASHQVPFPVDGILQGINGPAIAGADELMSRMNFFNLRYGGGAVPQSSSNFYNGVTLYNSRPSLTNARLTDNGASGGTQAAIGADMDSFLENEVARGPNIRRVTVVNNSLNGIWLLAQNNGFIQPTDATPMADNPSSLGGSQNYAFFQSLPIIVLAQLVVGQQYNVNTGGNTSWITDRLYVDSGTMMKFNRGSSIAVLNPGSSINVGSRDYITKFDINNSYGPGTGNFAALSANDPQVLFTSIYDDLATTTLVPQPINVTGETSPRTLGPIMWGSIGIQSGALAVMNAATFRYGGGSVNTQQFTLPSQSVLSFINYQSFFNVPFLTNSLGTRVYITNNNFYNNFDAAMQIEPDGLLAGDPLHPLVSGHPFLHGNVMQGNGIDGLAVLAARSYLLDPQGGYSYIGPKEANLNPYASNQSVNALWDLTDITYVVRGTIVLAGSSNGGGAAPVPNPTTYTAPPAPVTSLTIQSAIPGTVLADGSVIPSPGASVVVKLLSENTTHGAGDLSTYGSTGLGASQQGGAGFIAGVDDAVDPTPSPLIDPGAYSQIRILGIPGNQTTGQQRVPVIMTSLRDTTVGTTARGVKNYNILNSYPVGPFTPYANQSLTTPAPGDGGYIYIGGLSLTTYDLTDPRQGSLIDNADISYMTSIQIQGGGIVNPSTSTNPPSWLAQKSGYNTSFFGPSLADPSIQLNARMAVRISDSHLNGFSSAAVFLHPTNALALVGTGNFAARGTLKGQGATLYMYNTTISNSAEGVHANSETGNDDTGQSPYQLVLLNNTFYNNPYAIHTVAPQYNGQNSQSHVYTMAMNNIISNSTNTGIFIAGQAALSQLEYNLYFTNAVNVVATTTNGDFPGNINAVYGDPKFVNAAGLNFALSPGSAAIDAARSEIGPNPAGDAVYPAVTQPADGSYYGTRTNPATLTPPLAPGASNVRGGFGQVNDPRQILTLPGSNGFGFQDQWIPVLATAANGTTGPSSVPGSFSFAPLQGQRDMLGFIRIDDPGTPNTGFGRSPFQDIGAIEYVNLHPPQVAAVTALFAGAGGILVSQNFYTVGGKAGANVTPQYLAVKFSSPIAPSSISSDTVQLQALGVTANNAPGQLISLAGKLSYDIGSQILYISLGASGLTLPTDAYRLILVGSGSQVIFNPQGVALDGENLTNGDDPATGVQLPLPSGNGYPGGNFYNNFIINTVASSITPGTFQLSPSSDTNVVGDLVTYATTPTFQGAITEPNTALVPLAGQTAVIDIGVVWFDANGNPVGYFDPANTPAALKQFVRPNAGTALTDATGKFQVTVGQDAANTGLVTNTNPLLSSPYNVGTSGNLIPIPGTTEGYYVARVRVIDQSGNVSNPDAPGASAAVVVDTADPASAGTPVQAAITNPLNNAVIANPGSNFSFQVTANKNLDLTHFTASQIQLVQAGPDGTFNAGTIINIDPASITVTYLDAAANGGGGGKGREIISFKAASTLTNGLYLLKITGTGANGVRDIAGNLLGSDLTTQFAVYNPAAVHGVFVGAGFATDPTATLGTRANPFATINAAVAAAAVGDRIQVLPGVYSENVVMRQLVSLASASPLSTDSTYVRGNALQTIIRAPYASSTITVSATGLTAFVDAKTGASLQTEISGFSIASALVGNPALGPINPNSVGLMATNSTMLIDRNYFVDSGIGVLVVTAGSGALTSSVVNNGIIGNLTGMYLLDQGGTPATATEYVVNNSFAFNTTGFGAVNSSTTGTRQAYLANNIFWQNHDQTTSRSGLAVYSVTPDHLVLNNNMFQGNGGSDTNTSGVSNNLGNGFNPGALGTTAASALANQGNFVGFPAFVTPIDPRPGSDGPATFFLSANYGLSGSSAAINNALESAATRTDFLGNAENPNPTSKGFNITGYGPRDVGAFEYIPVGSASTTAVGGSFRVVTTSLVPDGSTQANGGTLTVSALPNTVIVNFSNDVDPSSLKANALSLSGAGVNSASPIVSTSAVMLDSHTVAFTLSGKFNTSGNVNVSVAAGSLKNKSGQTVSGYADKVYLNTAAPAPNTPVVTPPVVAPPVVTNPVVVPPSSVPTTPDPAAPPAAPVTPPPAAAPVTVGKGGK